MTFACFGAANAKRMARSYANDAIGRYVVRRMHLLQGSLRGLHRKWFKIPVVNSGVSLDRSPVHVRARRCKDANVESPLYSWGFRHIRAHWCTVVRNPVKGDS